MATLAGKVAIVTGASRGIGAAIAKSLAEAGAKIVVNYATKAGAAADVVAAIEAQGGAAIAVQADVSQADAAKILFDAAISQFGKVDILINNAGIILYKPLKDSTDEDFAQVFNINVKGVFGLLREAATRLEDGGRIVNFSTTVTRLTPPTYSLYAASKAAVEQLTRIFAKEIGGRGITVNSISPGPTNTELFTDGKSAEAIKQAGSQSPFGRIGEPADMTPAVLFLVSAEAGWITGQNLGVNGGIA